jgi:spectrin alpha
VQEAGQQLIHVSQLGGAEIEQRLRQLTDVWQELKNMAAWRGKKLEESIIYQQFLAKIEEEEAWISEKQQLLTVPDLGDNMAAVQAGLPVKKSNQKTHLKNPLKMFFFNF